MLSNNLKNIASTEKKFPTRKLQGIKLNNFYIKVFWVAQVFWSLRSELGHGRGPRTPQKTFFFQNNSKNN